MRIFTGLTLAAAIAASGLAISANSSDAAGGMAHAHMGHVASGWSDTPDGKGFLPVAIAEAETAIKHAGLAMKKPGDIKWMKLHARHVINAVDPSKEAKGPGLGYGVLKASAGAAKHIGIAAKSADASKSVKAHSVHVATSAGNTVARANQIAAHAMKVLSSKDAADAAKHTKIMASIADQLLAGFDANGDGAINWKKGEGGLNAAAKHMGFMAKGEGMN